MDAEKRLRNAEFYWKHRSLAYPDWDEARREASKLDGDWKMIHFHCSNYVPGVMGGK